VTTGTLTQSLVHRNVLGANDIDAARWLLLGRSPDEEFLTTTF